MRRSVLVVTSVLLVGCAAQEDRPPAASGSSSSAGSTSAATSTPPRSPTFDQALHDELMAMLERDQSGRSGGADPEGDAARTERLREILAEHGWPTFDLVGEDGEDAAWAITQHSDQDPAFQREALELLRAAVEEGQASPGNLAYLTDRIAVGAGEPQTYGTQVSCTAEGPEPATPLADPGAVDRLREEAGLEPLAAYLSEMDAICSGE